MRLSSSSWLGVISALGIGTFIGNLVSFGLSSSWQRRAWINDNKKAEWRELIDVIRQSIEKMTYRYDANYQVDEVETARLRGEHVIRDRIFISKVVQDSGIFDLWRNLVNEFDSADLTPTGRFQSLVKFHSKAQPLLDVLIRISREDLGIESPHHWYKWWPRHRDKKSA